MNSIVEPSSDTTQQKIYFITHEIPSDQHENCDEDKHLFAEEQGIQGESSNLENSQHNDEEEL